MKKLLLILFCLPFFGFGQPNYNITTNNNPWHGNLFFLTGGPPLKPVNIIDTSGTLLFSQFWGMKGFDWKVNKNNHLTYFDRVSKGWFVMDSLYNVVDSVFCKNGYEADNHDFMALPNGNYVLIAYDKQPYAMDTVVAGGDPNAIVEGFIIQELDANHNLIFEWKSWDHFHVTDNTYLNLTAASIQFVHGNAIDIDFDGHFLISCRGLDEITKIHRITGEIIWRWGGSQNEFTILGNDYPFTHQHCIRSLGNNKYLLYDNGNFSAQYTGSGNISRALEYQMDTINMTVEKKWEFIHPNAYFAPSTGSVQRLPNGNTLINWGNMQTSGLGARITEVDTINQIVFQLECVTNENVYRANKADWFFDSSIIGCPDALACNYNPNAIISDSSVCYYLLDNILINQIGNDLEGTTNSGVGPYSYLWNTNEITQSITPQQNGMYWLIITDANNCMGDTAFFNVTFIPTNITENEVPKKSMKMIINIFGEEIKTKKNTPLFYIYKDGTVEKKIIIE